MSQQQSDAARLDQTLSRLACATTDEFLSEVLNTDLIHAIHLLASTDTALRTLAAQVLGHINKRVRASLTATFPVQDLISLLASPSTPPASRHIATIHLDMGFTRLSIADRKTLMPSLTQSFASLPPPTRDCFLSLALGTLCGLPRPVSDVGGFYKNLFPPLRDADSANKKAFVEHLLDLLLFTPNPYQPGVVPGLSSQLVERWSKRYANSSEGIEAVGRHKLAVCAMLGCAEVFAATQVLPHLLVASGDQNEKVVIQAEWSLSRLVHVDMEDKALTLTLYAMFLGSSSSTAQTPQPSSPVAQPAPQPAPQAPAPTTPTPAAVAPDVRVPVTVALRGLIIGRLSQSVCAANAFPLNIKVVFETLFGTATNNRIRELGLHFASHIARRASPAVIAQMGPLLLQALMKTLDQLDGLAHSEMAASRRQHPLLLCASFEALGHLAPRSPTLFNADLRLVRRLFDSLDVSVSRGTPPSEDVVLHAQEALMNVAIAFKTAREDVRNEVLSLLMRILCEQNPASRQPNPSPMRHCAIRWVNVLFDARHAMSRYVCVLATSDSKSDVAAEAQRGLTAKRARDHPNFEDFVIFAQQKHQENKGVLNDTTLLNLISFCHRCLAAKSHLSRLSVDEYVRQLAQKDLKNAALESYVLLLEYCLATASSSNILVEQSILQLSLLIGASSELCSRYQTVPAWMWMCITHSSSSKTRTFGASCLRTVAKALGPKWALDVLSQTHLLVTQETVPGPRSGLFLAIGSLLGSIDRIDEIEDGRRIVDESVSVMSRPTMQSASPTDTLAACNAIAAAATSPLISASLQQQVLSHVLLGVSKPDPALRRASAVAAANIIASTRSSWDDAKKVLEQIFPVFGAKDIELAFSISEAVVTIANAGDGSWAGNVLDFALSKCQNSTSQLEQAGCCVCLMVLAKEVGVKSSSQSLERIEYKFDDAPDASTPEPSTASTVPTAEPATPAQSPPSVSAAELQLRLPRMQAQFSNMLAHPQEYIQEVASRGLSIVYGRGDEAVQGQLVRQLVATMTNTVSSSVSAVTARTVAMDDDAEKDNDTTTAAPTATDATTTTATNAPSQAMNYKEMCSVAVDMGKPELLYSLMELSKHNAQWSERTGAAFALTSIAKTNIQPYLKVLVPRLYRYQYDPNPRVQASMKAVWSGLVDNTSQALSEHWSAVCDEVATGLGSRLWRVRESCALALADLLVGRKISDLESHYERFLVLMFRIVDDIKESVRQAGHNGLKAMHSLTLALVDPASNTPPDINHTLALAVPLLLDHGLVSSSSEVRVASATQLQRICKTTAQHILPFAPKIVQVLLEYLSSSDSDVINYLQTRAEGQAAVKLEHARVAAVSQLPAFETCAKCIQYLPSYHIPEQKTPEIEKDLEIARNLVSAVCSVAKSGTGLMTRAGATKWLQMLGSQRPYMMQQFQKRISKTLLVAMVTERSPALQASYAITLATAVRLAPPNTQHETVSELVQHYLEDDSVLPDELPGHVITDDEYYGGPRTISGTCLLEITRRSEAIRGSMGTVVGCMALARHDSSPSVRRVWRGVWDEATSDALASMIRMYATEMIGASMTALQRSWRLKRSAACVLTEIAKNAVGGAPLLEHRNTVIPALLQSLRGRTFDGKHVILEALSSVCECVWRKEQQGASGLASSGASSGASSEVLSVVAAVLGEVGKKDLVYKTHALQCLATILGAYNAPLPAVESRELVDLVIAQTALPEEVKATSEDSSDADKINQGKESRTMAENRKLVCCSACLCLGHVRPPVGLEHSTTRTIACLLSGLLPNSIPAIRIAALAAVIRILSRDPTHLREHVFQKEWPLWHEVCERHRLAEEEWQREQQQRKQQRTTRNEQVKSRLAEQAAKRQQVFAEAKQQLQLADTTSIDHLEAQFAAQELEIARQEAVAAEAREVKDRCEDETAQSHMPSITQSEWALVRVIVVGWIACSKLANPLPLRRQLASAAVVLCEAMGVADKCTKVVDSATATMLNRRLTAMAHTDGDQAVMDSATKAAVMLLSLTQQ